MNLEEAFNAYYQELVFFGKRMICDKQAVEDIVVDVFIALKNPGINGLRFYLYRSVKNRCINYLKYIKCHRFEEIQENAWLEETVKIEVDYLKKMHEAIQHLTIVEKEVVDLYLKGKDASEIAIILNKEHSTIRSIKRTAVNKLRKSIL